MLSSCLHQEGEGDHALLVEQEIGALSPQEKDEMILKLHAKLRHLVGPALFIILYRLIQKYRQINLYSYTEIVSCDFSAERENPLYNTR